MMKKALQKESQKSESDVSENPLDFGFAKTMGFRQHSDSNSNSNTSLTDTVHNCYVQQCTSCNCCGTFSSAEISTLLCLTSNSSTIKTDTNLNIKQAEANNTWGDSDVIPSYQLFSAILWSKLCKMFVILTSVDVTSSIR